MFYSEDGWVWLFADGQKDLENNSSIDNEKKAKFGTANFLIELEDKRAIKVSGCLIYK